METLKKALRPTFELVRLEGLMALTTKEVITFRKIPNSFLSASAVEQLNILDATLYMEKDPIDKNNYVVILRKSTPSIILIYNTSLALY